jgi:hypothetical protein
MTRGWTRTTGTAVVVGTCLLLIAGAAAGSAQERGALVGGWTLNPTLTAQAGRRAVEDRAAIAGRRAPLGGGPVGVGGSGRQPTDTSSAGRRDSDESLKAREAVRLAALGSERVAIAADTRTLVLTDVSGITQTLVLDNKPSTSQMGALTVETRARWDDAAIVVERKFEGGVKVTDRYTVRDRTHLVIDSKIDSSQGDRHVQRVYDRSAP